MEDVFDVLIVCNDLEVGADVVHHRAVGFALGASSRCQHSRQLSGVAGDSSQTRVLYSATATEGNTALHRSNAVRHHLLLRERRIVCWKRTGGDDTFVGVLLVYSRAIISPHPPPPPSLKAPQLTLPDFSAATSNVQQCTGVLRERERLKLLVFGNETFEVLRTRLGRK